MFTSGVSTIDGSMVRLASARRRVRYSGGSCHPFRATRARLGANRLSFRGERFGPSLADRCVGVKREEDEMETSGFDSPWRHVVVRFVRSTCYEDPALALRAASVLSAEERQLLPHLEPAASRRDYLAAHALVRSMIAEMTGCSPERILIRKGKDGRSEALIPGAARGIGFSLSHADGIALCAVASGCSVGADVESERNVGFDPRGFAQMFCTRVELDELTALPAGERTERLLEIWTFREAMARATRPQFGVVSSEPHVAAVRLLPHHLATIAVVGAPAGHLVAVKFEEYRPR